jgi:hypothetical protein
VPDDGQQDWPVRLRDDEIAGSKPATPTPPPRHGPGLEPTSVTHGTILHNSIYRFGDQTAAFGLPAEDDGSRDDALLCLNMPSCPARRHDFDALRAASTRIGVGVGVGAQSATMIVGRAGVAVAERLGRHLSPSPAANTAAWASHAVAATLRAVLTG